MNRLNRKVEYALMALKYLADKELNDTTSAKEISEALGLPFDATARVLQCMAHQKLLRVEQGVNGGYKIACDLAKVSFHDLMEMIEGPTEIARCIHKHEDCDLLATCNIQAPMALLNRKIEQFYQTLWLADLLRLKVSV